ncbi:MAG TPA: hypothetical protein VF134_09080 [Candidatus Dormibacteraeota bacterium]
MSEEADCTICNRRRNNPAAVSSAFFQEEVGSELLQLSLQQAEARRKARGEQPVESTKPEASTAPRPNLRVVGPAPKPSREEARRDTGELDATGLREFSESVWLTPAGIIVRLAGDRIAEVVGEGKLQVIRQGHGARVRIGDLLLEHGEQGWSARLSPDAQ